MLAATSMRLELEKMASRRVEIFQALLKRMPKDVAVLEMGKDFPLDIGGKSPFYIHGEPLKKALEAAGEKGQVIAKGVDEEKRYVVVPPPRTKQVIESMGLKIDAPAYTYLAHEAGHAIEHDQGLGGRFMHGAGPTVISTLSGPLGWGLGAAAGHMVKNRTAGALLGAAVGGGVGGLGQLPLIHREGQASERAMQLLREVGARPAELTKAEDALSQAGGTYKRVGILNALIGAAGAGLSRLGSS